MDLKNPIRLYAVLLSRDEMERTCTKMPEDDSVTTKFRHLLENAKPEPPRPTDAEL